MTTWKVVLPLLPLLLLAGYCNATNARVYSNPLSRCVAVSILCIPTTCQLSKIPLQLILYLFLHFCDYLHLAPVFFLNTL